MGSEGKLASMAGLDRWKKRALSCHVKTITKSFKYLYLLLSSPQRVLTTQNDLDIPHIYMEASGYLVRIPSMTRFETQISANPGLGTLERLPLELRRQVWQEFTAKSRILWDAKPGGIRRHAEVRRAEYRTPSPQGESDACLIGLASRALYWEVSTELDRNRNLEIHICNPVDPQHVRQWVTASPGSHEIPWPEIRWERFKKVILRIHKNGFWSFIGRGEGAPNFRDFEEELTHVVYGMNSAIPPTVFHESNLEVCIPPEFIEPQNHHDPLWPRFLGSIFSIIRNIHGLEGFVFCIPKNGVSLTNLYLPRDVQDHSGEREKELLRSAWDTNVKILSKQSDILGEHQFIFRIPQKQGMLGIDS
ncbi:MAG: hypothetical protein Q9220_001069 [cf. Caloplaca sp. 1 TL-2023]